MYSSFVMKYWHFRVYERESRNKFVDYWVRSYSGKKDGTPSSTSCSWNVGLYSFFRMVRESTNWGKHTVPLTGSDKTRETHFLKHRLVSNLTLICIQNDSSVKESVDRLSKKDLCGIWTVFTKWITEITNLLKENPESTEKDSVMNSLLIMSTMATYTIHNMSNVEPQGLNPSVKAMNGSLKFITCKKAATSICKMSEHYWKVHPELEISLSINAIHCLLTQALHPKATVCINQFDILLRLTKIITKCSF